MGSMQAYEMATSGIDRSTALLWHLQSNHFPPLPAGLVTVALRVVDLAVDHDNWQVEVDPEGWAEYQGRETAPVWAIVEAWHLDAFIAAELDKEE